MRETVGVFLAKGNNNLVSHCKCENPFISAPGQMNCPWCGCGWLFICPKCRKAFTFARATRCNMTREQLAHYDLDGKYGKQPTREDIAEWIGFMKMFTKDIQLGEEYAYLDGYAIPVSERNLQFDGIHALHDLEVVPQTAALQDRKWIENTIGNKNYWNDRKLHRE